MNDSSQGKQLLDWAKKMGYKPPEGNEYPSAESFQKLFRGKSGELWTQVMTNVKPKEEVLHVQKNLILKQLREGVPVSKLSVSGKLCEQVKLSEQLASKQKEQSTLLDSIDTKRNSLLAQEKKLRKSAFKVVELERQIDEFRKKGTLFQVKTYECRSNIAWFKEMMSVADALCPPLPYATPQQISSDSIISMLSKCIDAIRNFHTNSSENGRDFLEVSEDNENHNLRLQTLMKEIRENTSGWGAQLIYDAITSKLMPGLHDEVYGFVGSLNNSESDFKKSRNCDIENATALLPAVFVKSVAENINLKTKETVKAAEMQKLKEKHLAEVEVHFGAQNFTTFTLSENAVETIKHWVELQLQKVELTAKLSGIKSQINNLRENSSFIFTSSSQLTAAKQELFRLNTEIGESKRQVEENIAHRKCVGSRLKSALALVHLQRCAFKSQVPMILQVPKPGSFLSVGDSSSPKRKLPLSSTMIGNVTADISLCFDTTASLCDFAAEKSNGQSNHSEIVSILRESVSKEAKYFSKLHLDRVPFVLINGHQKELECNLMVQGPAMMARTPSIQQKSSLRNLRGAPFSSASSIIMNQLYAQNHLRALRKLRILRGSNSLRDVFPKSNTEHLSKLSSVQEKVLQEHCDEVDVALRSTETFLTLSKETMEFWLERPVQNAIPENLVVNGQKFSEWRKLYEKALGDMGQ